MVKYLFSKTDNESRSRYVCDTGHFQRNLVFRLSALTPRQNPLDRQAKSLQ